MSKFLVRLTMLLILLPILLFGVAGENEIEILKSDADTILIAATDTILVDTFSFPLKWYENVYFYTYAKGLGTIEATDTLRVQIKSYADSVGSLLLVNTQTRNHANTLATGCYIDTILYVGRADHFIVEWIALDDDAAGTNDSLAVGPIGIGKVGRVAGR